MAIPIRWSWFLSQQATRPLRRSRVSYARTELAFAQAHGDALLQQA